MSETTSSGPDIRSRRETLGLTRAALAVAVDCSVTYLALIEVGVIPKGGDVFPRLLATLNALEVADHDA